VNLHNRAGVATAVEISLSNSLGLDNHRVRHQARKRRDKGKTRAMHVHSICTHFSLIQKLSRFHATTPGDVGGHFAVVTQLHKQTVLLGAHFNRLIDSPLVGQSAAAWFFNTGAPKSGGSFCTASAASC
jgi:hypothetical protein